MSEAGHIAGAPRASLLGTALDNLGRQIAGARYAEGDTLPIEPRLAEELGVSRSTVREAVRALVALGMLEVRTRTGTRVRPRRNWNILNRDVLDWLISDGSPDTGLLAAIDEAREVFEPKAAAFAAERASDAEIAAIAQAYDDMRDAARTGDIGAAVIADRAFHLAILAATANPILEAFDTAIDAVLGLLFKVATADHEQSFRENLANHGRILDAIRNRQPDAARDAMIDTIHYTRGNLRKHVLEAPRPVEEVRS